MRLVAKFGIRPLFTTGATYPKWPSLQNATKKDLAFPIGRRGLPVLKLRPMRFPKLPKNGDLVTDVGGLIYYIDVAEFPHGAPCCQHTIYSEVEAGAPYLIGGIITADLSPGVGSWGNRLHTYIVTDAAHQDAARI